MAAFIPSHCSPWIGRTSCFYTSNRRASGHEHFRKRSRFHVHSVGRVRKVPLRIFMNAQQQGSSPLRDDDDSDQLQTSKPLTSDEEGTFVLEEELVIDESEEEQRLIWNKLPSPRALFETSYVTDVFIILGIVALAYGLVLTTGSLFSSAPYSLLSIDTSLKVLPWYAAQSLTRMAAGYTVSLIFSLTYAYVAYRVKFAAKLLMLVIDVLQSIPLLSFLPGVVLGLIAIFPGARVGVELAAVLLLFTSMAWNMLLGFYQSLCCIPNDLVDVAQTFRLTPWKRFWTLELPAGAIGLVWNSVISAAGGWFFLISIESFELGNRDFKLPGIGSYLAVAAETSNYSAIFSGLLTIIAIIVVIDFLVWQPLIAWSAKFSYGSQTREENRPRSVVLNTLQRSPLVRNMHSTIVAPAWEKFVNVKFTNPFTGEPLYPTLEENGTGSERLINTKSDGTVVPRTKPSNVAPALFAAYEEFVKSTTSFLSPLLSSALPPLILAVTGIAVGYGVWQSAYLFEAIPVPTWISIGTAALATFGRVIVALALSLLWTVPAGVAIGRNPKLSALLQPIVQVAASVPATALFPFVLLFLVKLGGGLQVGSIALMMLGTMWYVLFNVIAGAQAIPEELFEVDSIYNKEGWIKQWRSLVLPGIFPYLITGIVTAVGGAWNASIVSEYVVFQGGVLKTHGLGSLISEAAASGDYAVLLAGTVVMSILVLLTNKFVWGPLYRLAETKYRI